VRLPIGIEQLRSVHVGVTLRGAQASMTQQFLNHTQICASFEQVRRERVSKRVRADSEPCAARSDIFSDEPIDTARR